MVLQVTVDWSDRGLLGTGGFGEVRRGVWKRVNYAFKVLFSHGDSDVDRADVCQRLLLEAAALASVNHPYVVRVFGVVTASGATDTTGRALSPCLVMELFEGRPLQQFVHDEAPSFSDKVRLLQHIAIGLAEIHDRGLVHGDMTSNNVLARRDGGGVIAVRIIDFGMSSVAAGGRGVGGTTAFMAPELLAVPDDDDDGYVP